MGMPNKKATLDETVFVKDIKANNTPGGNFSSGAWQTRDLNTLENPKNFTWVSLSSNQFTLQPGEYLIEAVVPAQYVRRHKAKLRNITDSSDTSIGSSEYSGASNTEAVQTHSFIKTYISITSAKTYQIQHQCELTYSVGFGAASNFSVSEVYTVVRITKIG